MFQNIIKNFIEIILLLYLNICIQAQFSYWLKVFLFLFALIFM